MAEGTEESTISQASYQETPYEQQAWEVVGELQDNNSFIALDVEVVPRAFTTADPMFADFGGVTGAGDLRRYHIPGHEPGMVLKKKDQELDPNLVSISKEEIEKIKAQAFEEGKKAGLLQSSEKQNVQVEQMKGRFQAVLGDIAGQINQNIVSLEREAVRLAVEIAERMIGYAVEINPEYILHLLKEALTHVGSAEIRKVRVSPQDYEFLQVIAIPQHMIETGSTWAFESDDTVKMGCIVETSSTEIDYRIDASWERMKDSILKVLG